MGEPVTSLEVIKMFVAYMRGRSLSEYTIRRRRSSLTSFARFLAPLPILDADGRHLEEWVATLSAPRTRHAYRSDVGALFAWAVRRNLATANPIDDTDPIRVPKGLPHPVPAELVPLIVNGTADPRLRLGLALAAYAGLRCAEICSATTDDIRLHDEPPVVVVRCGKWSKDRSVPLHPTLLGMLERRRHQGPLVPFHPDSLGKKASAHMRSMGHDYTIHQLRATFATEFARGCNGNVVLTGAMLGHESPATTMGYIKLVTDHRAAETVRGLYVA